MTKIHTREKRKLGLSTSHKHKYVFIKCKAKVKPRSFKTEEAAHAYAKEHGTKDYTLRNLKSPESSTKKIRIEAKSSPI